MAAFSPTSVQVAAEIVCGALHKTYFTFLGETDNGASTWFTRGDKPQIMRVEVQRSSLAPMVLVNVEFPNVATGQTLAVRKVLQIDCKSHNEEEITKAATEASIRVLEMFRDLVSQKGDASAASANEHLAHKREYDV